MVTAIASVLEDADFWSSARRTMLEVARPEFRKAFLVGAALGAQTPPWNAGRRDLPAVMRLAQKSNPTRILTQLLGHREPEEVLALVFARRKDVFPGVGDDFRPTGDTLLPFDGDAILRATDDFIAGYSDAWWQQIERTTRDRLRVVMRRAADEGWTMPQITTAVEPLFGPVRAKLIAVSETTNLMGQGAQITYQRAGFGSWIWRTVADPYVDAICNALATQSDPARGGTPFPMTRRFERAHPNCRCWPVPYGEPTAPRAPEESASPLPQSGPFAPVSAGRDTEELFTKDGQWIPSRQRLHDQIVRDFMAGASPVNQPRAYMMGGGPASGKSTVIKRGQVQLPNNIVSVDPDAIKAKLPEYQRMVQVGDPKAAAFTHEESSYLSKRIASESAQGRYNVLLDGVGDSSIDSLAQKVQQLRGGGQRVIGNYVSLDTEKAVELATKRAAATGRDVPLDYLREAHANVSCTLPQAIDRGLFDELRLYDTNIEDAPRLVLSQLEGRAVIHDAKLWDDFVRKAGGERQVYAFEKEAIARGREVRARMSRLGVDTLEELAEADMRATATRIRNRPTEVGRGIRPDGTVLEQTDEAAGSVSFTESDLRTLRGGKMIHNHPSSRSFSLDDVEIQRDFEIAELRVASRLGDYRLEITDAGKLISDTEWREVYEEQKVVQRYLVSQERAKGVVFAEGEADLVAHHRIWQEYQRRGWVRYTTEPTPELSEIWSRHGATP